MPDLISTVESPIAALACLAVALATAALLSRLAPAAGGEGRYAAIDGLRGYLAYFVFLHHISFWHGYALNGQWLKPASNVFTLLGRGSVAMFFMITAFLFFGKILDARDKPIDWVRLYASRVTRLVPLYLFAMAVLFLFVAIASKFTLQEPLPALAKNAFKWLTFVVFGEPEVNRVVDTHLIIAGVVWSLPYEWFFYFCLPLLAVLAGRKAPWVAVGASVLVAAFWIHWGPEPYELLSFVAGIVAAMACRSPRFGDFARGRIAPFIVVAALVALVALYPSAHHTGAILLLATAFFLIAGGCSLFGVLTWPVSRLLGDMSYSLYLLHGLLLYATFRLVLGNTLTAGLSPLAHWGVALVLTPLLVAGCYLSYRHIEKPAMDATPQLVSRLRATMRHITESEKQRA